MEKMICIPEWRYELMLKSFDEAMKELEELKKSPCRSGNFYKGRVTRTPTYTPDTGLIVPYPATKRKDFMIGFIRLNRVITDWEWYKNVNTCKLFLHMLLKANWKDERYQGVLVPRGSFVSSIRSLALETGLSVQNVKTALSHLRKADELTQYQHGKISVFTVKNYDVYVKSNPQSNPQTNPEPAHIKEKKNKIINNIYTRDACACARGFSNFEQRDYDFDILEQMLLQIQGTYQEGNGHEHKN